MALILFVSSLFWSIVHWSRVLTVVETLPSASRRNEFLSTVALAVRLAITGTVAPWFALTDAEKPVAPSASAAPQLEVTAVDENWKPKQLTSAFGPQEPD